jgi:hypothetical protein
MLNALSAIVLMFTGLCVIAKAATFEGAVTVDLFWLGAATGLLIVCGSFGFLRASLRR